MSEEPTVKLKDPNWSTDQLFGLESNGPVGFAERLNIIQPSSFDDEPTIPYGLCQSDNLEEAEGLIVEEVELVGEKDIIDECETVPWMRDLLEYLEE